MLDKWYRLGEHVIAMAVQVSRFRGYHAITKAVVQLGDVEILDKLHTVPSWRLLPRQWEHKFQSLERQARQCVGRWSVQGFGVGSVLLPICKLPEVYDELLRLQTQFDETTREFIAAYPRIIEELRASTTDIEFASIAKHLPTVQSLPSKFSLRWITIPIGTSVTPELVERMRKVVSMAEEHGNPELVEETQAIMGQLETSLDTSKDVVSKELVDFARSSINGMVTDMVDSICSEPRQQIAEACASLMKSMKTGSVRMGTIRNVRAAFEKFEAFSFMADEDLLEQLRVCSEALGVVDTKVINSNVEVQAQLSEAMTGLCTNLTATLERSRNNCDVLL